MALWLHGVHWPAPPELYRAMGLTARIMVAARSAVKKTVRVFPIIPDLQRFFRSTTPNV
jgi:hypothetical protein